LYKKIFIFRRAAVESKTRSLRHIHPAWSRWRAHERGSKTPGSIDAKTRAERDRLGLESKRKRRKKKVDESGLSNPF
jgi:hypothetical protein